MAATTIVGGRDGVPIRAYTTGTAGTNQEGAVLGIDGSDLAIRADAVRGLVVNDVFASWLHLAGQVIDSTTVPEQMNGGTPITCKGLIVGQHPNNTGRLAFGASNTVRADLTNLNTPVFLDVGDQLMLIRIDDPSKVWCAAEVAGNSVLGAVLL